MCDTLNKLKQLTENLPPIPVLMDYREINDDITEYHFDTGTSISWNLFRCDDIGIACTFIPKDTVFEKHHHLKSYEIIIVLSGIVEFTLEDSTSVFLNKYDKITIDKNSIHSARACTDTWIIALTVPADEGFPE